MLLGLLPCTWMVLKCLYSIRQTPAWAVWAQHFSQGPVNTQRLKGHEENSSKCLKSFARTLCNVLDKLEIDVLTVSKRQEEPDPWERKNLLSVVENQVHKLIYSS